VELIGVDKLGSVQTLWDTLKNELLEATDKVCGWTKGPVNHKTSWWWNDEVDVATIKVKRKRFKAWKKGGDKEIYLAGKCRTRREVYRAKKVILYRMLCKSAE